MNSNKIESFSIVPVVFVECQCHCHIDKVKFQIFLFFQIFHINFRHFINSDALQSTLAIQCSCQKSSFFSTQQNFPRKPYFELFFAFIVHIANFDIMCMSQSNLFFIKLIHTIRGFSQYKEDESEKIIILHTK